MLELVGDRLDVRGDPILMRGDYLAGVVERSMRWGKGQKGGLTYENARTPRTHEGMEPHGKTYFGRAKHTSGWYLALAPVGIGRKGEGANQHTPNYPNRTSGHGVRDFRKNTSDY